MARDVEAGKAFVRVSVKDDMRGLRNISSKMKAWGAGMAGIGAGMAGIGAAIIAPMFKAADSFADTGKQLLLMSARTGASVEFMSALGYAAVEAGISLEDAEGALRKMQKAAVGSGDAFAKVGVNVRNADGSFKDAETLFLETTDKLAGVTDTTKQAALAMEIFGKSGTTILPMLKNGAGGVSALIDEAKRLGFTMSTEDAEAAKALHESLELVERGMGSIWRNIGAAAAPALGEMADWLGKIVMGLRDWMKANRPLIGTIFKFGALAVGAGTAVAGLGTAMAIAGAAVGGIVSAISAIGAVVGAVLSPIGLLIGLIAGGTAAFITFTDTGRWLAESLMADFRTAFGDLKDAFSGVVDALKAGDLGLAAQIALKGVKLAFLQAIKTILPSWGGFVKSLLTMLSEGAKGIIATVNRIRTNVLAISTKVRQSLSEGRRDNELAELESMRKRMPVEEYIRRKGQILQAHADRMRGIVGDADEGLAQIDSDTKTWTARVDELTAKVSDMAEAVIPDDGDLARLREELDALRSMAAGEAAALGDRTGAPTPTAVKNAVEAGVGATTGTFSAAGAQVAFAAVGNEQWQRQTAENTERTAKNLEKIVRRNFDPYEFFGFGSP